MEKKWGEVYNYLSSQTYPEVYDKSQRQNLRRFASKIKLRDGQLWCGSRLVLKTKEDAKNVFEEFHSSPVEGHTGINKTRTALSQRFYWPGMTVDIENWISACDKCQKVVKPLAVDVKQECIRDQEVSDVWELVGIDLFGPLPQTADGFQYVLAATDCFSKWVEAFPLKTKNAAEVAKNLCSIICRHGCPKRILSSWAGEFVKEVNHALCELLHTKRKITAAYHSQTNSLDAETNDDIKRALEKLVTDQQNNWDVYLEAALFSIRSKVHTATKHSPFSLMYGREAVFPSEIPIHMSISNIVLPEESAYSEFVLTKKKKVGAHKQTAMENVKRSQEKQKQGFVGKGQKKHRQAACGVGDEVLRPNARKHGIKVKRVPDQDRDQTVEQQQQQDAQALVFQVLPGPQGVALGPARNCDQMPPLQQCSYVIHSLRNFPQTSKLDSMKC